MSENFTGITFAKQKVAPSDDAIIRRAILPDGILTGCELSYSGSTLTMAAGQLLICGRQIRHPSVQNWAVLDAVSGFARLLLTVDLTRTATKEVFDQVVDTIEYAASEDGFPDLEQADINGAGARYQVVACVVSLGTGGITGIVSQLPMSRVEGGGGLNFNVVDGLTQPSDPDTNAIWVITDTLVTGWYFSATQPENMAEGEVWFPVGTTSPVAFNALKKNSVMVYPLSAKQMVDGTLVDVTAKSYQGGTWVSWILSIFKDGIMYCDYTIQVNSGSIVYEDNVFTVSPDGGTFWRCYLVLGPVDITSRNAITMRYVEHGEPAEAGHGCIFIAKNTGATYEDAVASANSGGWTGGDTEKTVSLNVEEVSGKYYIYCGQYSSAYINNARTSEILEVT